MNKWVILLLVAMLVAAGYWIASQQKYIPPWAQPKYGEITRGDIEVPISASGLIHANRVIEVKPEASGEILAVPVVEGDFVGMGDRLVVLDPDDEQRTLDRVTAELQRAEAILQQVRVAVRQADANIENAISRQSEMKAQAEITRYEWEDKIKPQVDEQGRSSTYAPQEIHDAEWRYKMMQAQLRTAEIAVQNARLAKEDAEAAVKSQEAVVESARKQVEDAEERLRETTIVAPQDAIVTQVYVKPGMLVQSGTQSLTGGTPLMTLADVSKKKVIARLDEADYGRVLDISPLSSLPEMPGLREAAAADAESIEKRSGAVTLTVDAFPEQEFAGRIDRVEPQGKLNAGSSIIQFDVHVEITDDERHMLPLGAQAQVEFTVESAHDTLRVPAEAVKAFEEQRGVYIKAEPAEGSGEQFGKKFVACRFGISDGEYTQLLEVIGNASLDEGTEVFTRLPQDPGEDR